MQSSTKNLFVRYGDQTGDYSCCKLLSSPQNIRKSFYCSVAGLAVFLLGFIVAPYLIAEASATELASASVDWGSVSLTLDTDVAATSAGSTNHGDILFGSIVPTSHDDDAISAATGNVGTLKILKKTIAIETTGSYVSVWLSTNGESTALTHTADSSLSIPTTTGSLATPTTFSGTGWGYALATDAFPSESLYAGALNYDMTFATNQSVYSGTTWSGVTDFNHPTQIWKATTSNLHGFGGESGDPNNSFNIYYGVMIDTDTLAGAYENNLIYTALASSASLDQVSTNLSRSKPFGTSAISETIAFDLAESINSNSLSADDIEVFLVRHSDAVANNYDPNLLQEPTTTCAITSFVIDNTKAALTCTIPTLSEIADSTADTTTEAGRLGRYDFWVRISKYNLNYLSRIDGGAKEAFAYVGLQSRYKDASDGDTLKPYVTKMQEITNRICANTNRWNNQLGDNARILDPTNTTQIVANIMTTTTETVIDEETGEETEVEVEVVDGAATATASAAVGVGTFELTDTRDNHTYQIRRLANGGCYMVQNLNLDLEDFAGTNNLTAENTDLISKTTWDPVDGLASSNYTNGTSYNRYTWYQATAESGTADMVNSNASDTICPKQWTMTDNWYWLIRDTYNAATSAKGVLLPLSKQSVVWTKRAGSSSATNAQTWGLNNSNQGEPKTSALSIRCMSR